MLLLIHCYTITEGDTHTDWSKAIHCSVEVKNTEKCINYINKRKKACISVV